MAPGVTVAPLTPLPAPAPGVALWWCALDVPAALLRAFESWLSDSERARAARFGTAILRDRYIVGRASLRSVLGMTIGMHPASVPIVSGERGRPRLAGSGHAGTDAPSLDGTGVAVLDFNISHTAGVAMIGITSGVRIGVDIERQDRAINAAGIARKFLSAAERADLAALSADAVRQRILELWTCKEAMSKATGDALSAPFAVMSVDFAGGPRLDDGPMPYVPARWELRSASVPAGYVATVALWRRGE